MTRSRRRTSQRQKPLEQSGTPSQSLPQPTGKIFLGEEEKRLLRRFNQHIVNKLGLGGNRSVKM